MHSEDDRELILDQCVECEYFLIKPWLPPCDQCGMSEFRQRDWEDDGYE